MRATGLVTVVGHTDSTGSSEANQALSDARGRAVRDALQAGFGAGVSFEASCKGEMQPVPDEATPDGRQANRRVAIACTVKPGP